MKRPTRVTRGSFLVTDPAGVGIGVVVVERAELEDLDHFVVEPEPALAEQDRTGAVEPDRERRQRHERRQQAQQDQPPTTRSNRALTTMFQSAIGLSKMSRTGTLPMYE